jgi:hypothetical protein
MSSLMIHGKTRFDVVTPRAQIKAGISNSQ